MAAYNRITKVYERARRIPFDNTSRIVLMSDCHRSDGSRADNFYDNRNIYKVAMRYYDTANFIYIELGDGDELWENKQFSDITRVNGDIFEILAKFYRENRLSMIYGNHDIVKRDAKWTENNLTAYVDAHSNTLVTLFPDIKAEEGIVLTHQATGAEIFLLHGHQADFFNYDLWRVSKFLVRYLWRPLETLGIKDPTSASQNPRLKIRIEDEFCKWAMDRNLSIITGHTHRYVFPSCDDVISECYNDGCCVYPQFITAMEIVNDNISLIKWSIGTKPDGVLFVEREVIAGPRSLKIMT